MAEIEDGFKDFKKYVEEGRYTQAGQALNKSLEYFRENGDQTEPTLMVIFDLSYRNSFFGSCNIYMGKARPSETCSASSWLRMIGLTTNEGIILEVLDSKVYEALIELILRAEVNQENEDCVANAFIALGCFLSDCERGIKEVLNGPFIEKLMEIATKWAQSIRACKGFMQFMCALVSTKNRDLKPFVKTLHLDIAMNILKTRGDGETSDIITDSLSLIEYMTDIKEGDDERPYSSAMLYLYDKGLYDICFEGLADDTIDTRLRILCARCIGNAVSLSENYSNIESVIGNY